jgi:MFS family permease
MRLSTPVTFFLLLWINLINFCDRGIIPGSLLEFSAFIAASPDRLPFSINAQLGLLQSSFVIGLIIGFVGFSKAAHRFSKSLFLTAVGCGVWVMALLLSGLSYYSKSYVFLLLARMLSGFGEASLQCTVPPWVQARAPAESKGAWLSLFCTAIPVGTALGYSYSSALATTVGWAWAFFGEALVMFPCVLLLFSLEHGSSAEGYACYDHLHSDIDVPIETGSQLVPIRQSPVGGYVHSPMTMGDKLYKSTAKAEKKKKKEEEERASIASLHFSVSPLQLASTASAAVSSIASAP